MQEKSSKRTLLITKIIDFAQLIIVSCAGIALAFDLTGIIELPWLKVNLMELTFVAVCALIISSILERQVSINALALKIQRISEKLDNIGNGLAGIVSADLLLRDRKGYTKPLDLRLEGAQEVSFVGISLLGVATY